MVSKDTTKALAKEGTTFIVTTPRGPPSAGWARLLHGSAQSNSDPLVAPESNPGAQTEEKSGSLLVLALLAPLVGAAAGLLGAIFRLVLEAADRFCDALIAAS